MKIVPLGFRILSQARLLLVLPALSLGFGFTLGCNPEETSLNRSGDGQLPEFNPDGNSSESDLEDTRWDDTVPGDAVDEDGLQVDENVTNLEGTFLDGLGIETSPEIELCSPAFSGMDVEKAKAYKVSFTLQLPPRGSIEKADLSRATLSGGSLRVSPFSEGRRSFSQEDVSSELMGWAYLTGVSQDALHASISHHISGIGDLEEHYWVVRKAGEDTPVRLSDHSEDASFYWRPKTYDEFILLGPCDNGGEDSLRSSVMLLENGDELLTVLRYYHEFPILSAKDRAKLSYELPERTILASSQDAEHKPLEFKGFWSETDIYTNSRKNNHSEIDLALDLWNWRELFEEALLNPASDGDPDDSEADPPAPPEDRPFAYPTKLRYHLEADDPEASHVEAFYRNESEAQSFSLVRPPTNFDLPGLTKLFNRQDGRPCDNLDIRYIGRKGQYGHLVALFFCDSSDGEAPKELLGTFPILFVSSPETVGHYQGIEGGTPLPSQSEIEGDCREGDYVFNSGNLVFRVALCSDGGLEVSFIWNRQAYQWKEDGRNLPEFQHATRPLSVKVKAPVGSLTAERHCLIGNADSLNSPATASEWGKKKVCSKMAVQFEGITKTEDSWDKLSYYYDLTNDTETYQASNETGESLIWEVRVTPSQDGTGTEYKHFLSLFGPDQEPILERQEVTVVD